MAIFKDLVLLKEFTEEFKRLPDCYENYKYCHIGYFLKNIQQSYKNLRLPSHRIDFIRHELSEYSHYILK